MQERLPAPYIFTRAERPLFAEVYFPKKIAYQGTIFTALEEGLKEEKVKDYLKERVLDLMEELKEYPDLLNPHQFKRVPRRRSRPISRDEALTRIDMYRSSFEGWSMYEVNGVFLGKGDGVDEELTQVIRLMFRFRSRFSENAERMGCGDALRAIHFWFMDFCKRGRLREQKPWHPVEKRRFLNFRSPWPAHKRKFVEKNFEPVMKESMKWLDDCALFTFGYLVRKFWETVLERESREDQIWTTSVFDLSLNVVKRMEPVFQRKEESDAAKD